MINLRINYKMFSERILLKDTQVHIKQGSFTVITGPSGVGKSTLLNIIGLLDNDFDGEYFFRNWKLPHTDKRLLHDLRRKYFGYVFQDALINEKQSIKRNLMSAIDYNQHHMFSSDITNILNKVGINELNKPTSVLSGGEKQRLSLARALFKSPAILLADEPTASLDKKNKYNVMRILEDYNRSGGTVIMVTHDLELMTEDIDLIQISSH